ncbi:MAG: bifunctional [glutamate--ammonia ligase]-adenylyl-L-tyrosine phosphorylase/[glutamate--ammonia-ligase] adenylyltransferase [bacterium]|nr:bifunctional [glutamate--ammonia ligase]-adenylyl-L-tyrosine phosphorylase/[glutamate--ammonia-ligase] adenylyltransferase [bacterium]MDT8366281.1 bifunctional [glutamate--ammonia ligase]-adenylyl-L-tyrosine phosphorylase/[glutamate--ammonia-ligase] adenylyltransferase [bacterium]
MASAVDQLVQLIKTSGRLPESDGLVSLLSSLLEQSPTRGLGPQFPRSAVKAALKTADPHSALVRMVRLLSAVDDPNFYSLLEDSDGIKSLMVILGYSNYLSSLIMRSPEDYIWLMRKVGLTDDRTMADMRFDLMTWAEMEPDAEETTRILRRNKYREMLRTGVRDLLGTATLEETILDISNLAEVSVEMAVEAAYVEQKEKHGIPIHTTEHGMNRPSRFCVLGMGKLGGGELNYSSDIDLFYLYTAHEGMTTGRPTPSGGYKDAVENHRFFVRMSKIVTGFLNDRTADGIVFRVDLRLRPEGESGEIAYSVPSLETYYQSWGRTVDRLALLKARAIGGERRLGEDFLESLSPFVYRRLLDYDTLGEIGLLKDRIDRHVREKFRGVRDVKLGRGGIREIEFLIQTLQLINGGKTPSIRGRNSLRSLRRLMQNGFLSERDAEGLREAYIFLRTVEHRVQLVEERQTQLLPKSKEGLEKLAWSMGFVKDGFPDRAGFEGALDSVTDRVAEHFDKYFSRREDSVPGAPGTQEDLLDEGLDREDVISKLGEMGFANPEGAYQNLMLLRDGPPHSHFPDNCRHLLRQIAPGLLANLKEVADPDAVLVNLDRFISRVGARASYYSMLAGNPEAVRLLVVLFGQSPYLSSSVIRYPDLLDVIVGGTDLSVKKDSETMVEEVRGILLSSPSLEDGLNILRRYRNGEILRIGLGDLLDVKDQITVNGELSTLAEVLVNASLSIARKEAGGGETTEEGDFAVVALGKMGGSEMNYSSDLDMIFIYEGPESSREYFTKVAQKMIMVLTSPTEEGVLYRIDMRLRPSGQAGPLVTTLDAFEVHHREKAMVWEQQAMTKARWVAGDEGFRGRITSLIEDLTYTRPLSLEGLAEIIRIRGRMEEEIAREGEGDHYDAKAGQGGLVDVEFAVQILQLAHGDVHGSLRTTNTVEVLDALFEAGLVNGKQYNALRRAYLFYREIENRSQIYQDRSNPRIPKDVRKAMPLARRLGYQNDDEGAGQFLDEVLRTREAVRQAFDEIVSGLREKMS